MIPFALSGMEFRFSDGTVTEASIEELSADEITFRTGTDFCVDKIRMIHIFLYCRKDSTYHFRELSACGIVLERQEKDYFIFRLPVQDDTYASEVAGFWREYAEYIELKTNADPQELSKALTDCSLDEEVSFSSSFAVQTKGWYSKAEKENSWNLCSSDYELAVALDNPGMYAEYLSMPFGRFMETYWRRRGFSKHPLTAHTIKRIYIGNQFCQHLLPNAENTVRLLDKALEEKLSVTLVFTYMREDKVDYYKTLFDSVRDWCEQNQAEIEVLVNDWGMLTLLNGRYSRFVPVYGILLNKRRKDPRMGFIREYKAHPELSLSNSLSNEGYLKYLTEQCGIRRFEWETSGTPISLCEGKHSLHFPYYQTNTSQYCPLYARCHEGSRGRQQYIQDCPEYCRDYVFLYPEHLSMVGMYNSLFGYDAKALMDGGKMEEYLGSGIDRLVLNLF